MDPLLKKVAVRYGGIMSAIAVLYLVIAYVVDPYYIMWEFVRYPLNIVLLIMSVLTFKKWNGGYSSFKETFSAWILPTIMTTAILIVVKLILFWGIDPNFITELRGYEVQFQQYVAKLANPTPEQLQMQAEMLDEQLAVKTKVGLINEYLFLIVVNTIFGLLISAALTKAKPLDTK
ncbi:MAG: DUF4199 domain-containing protein [Bacteroidetes bacterium]|nr:MAG: DUF4199 domain-containing protein [Bacteroidota bacterium]